MKIELVPMRLDVMLSVSVLGDVLTLNGEDFDLSGVTEGATLPASAISSDFIAGDVTRTGGVLIVPLILPHGSKAPLETRFPVPIEVSVDGPVALPPFNQEPSA